MRSVLEISDWRAAALVLVAAVLAALPPLHEMDLAQHLAMGEWIVQHRAVPFTEPFAWTREGQPYFAYSWLAQLTYYLLLDTFGPAGLHVLAGLTAAAAAAAVVWAARQLGAGRDAALGLGVLHVALLWGVANTLRPQQLLFVSLPLAWGVVARIRDHGAGVRRVLALAMISAFAANTHIFFPLTAAPIVFFLLTDRFSRPLLLAAGALVAGWFFSPYALAWPDVFALNFGDNILLRRPPSISEFVPGFEYAADRPGVIAAAAALAAVPWLASAEALTARERVVRAVFWTAGLLLFAYAGRLILAWWVLALPQLGAAAERMMAAARARLRPPLARAIVIGGIGIMLLAAAPPVSPVFWRFEGGTVHRMLPRAGEDPALWLPGWLLCHTRPGARGRIFTEFNYGSELNWRLPAYSPSIDGRTIFPDSDAVEFSFQAYGRQQRHATTWMRADLALLDRSSWLAPVLDRDPSWVLLAQAQRTSRGGWGALWAKRAWWSQWGEPVLLPAVDIRPGDARATCASTGTFPK